ncbi:MAG: hypothetical protein Q9180_007551, partial [Flavoplaca navasiana]
SRILAIQQNWGEPPARVLNLKHHAADRRQSRYFLEQIARLREAVSLDEGGQWMIQIISTRQTSGKTPHTLTDALVKPRDIKLALDKSGAVTAKRERWPSAAATGKKARALPIVG